MPKLRRPGNGRHAQKIFANLPLLNAFMLPVSLAVFRVRLPCEFEER
jgi:hypothetical protein